MPRSRITIRQYKRNYTPSKYDNNKGELKLIIYGVDKAGNLRKVKVLGTKPRFWIKKEEYEKRKKIIHKGMENYDVRIEDEGFRSAVDDSELLTVYTEYPFHVRQLRQIFEWSGQANVKYVDAVVSFYRLSPYINIPNRDEIHVSEIESVEEPEEEIQFNDLVFDIETREDHEIGETGLVVCATAQYRDSIHCGITRDIDRENVKQAFQDSSVLSEACHTNDETDFVQASTQSPVIDFHVCDDPSYPFPEELAEIKLFRWCCYHFSQVPFLLGHYVWGFDIETMQNHAKAKNREIREWNRNHTNQREYYPLPKDYLKNTQVVDTMELYSLFHYGSVHVKGRRALDWIGLEELGYGKIERDKIWEMYDDNPEHLMLYNIWDCEILWRLFHEIDLLIRMRGHVEMNYTTIDNIKYKKSLVTSDLRWDLWKEKLIIPTEPRDSSEEIKVGGLVEDAPSGVFRVVLEADNSGEYSSIIIGANVDYRTKVNGEPDQDRPYSKFRDSGNKYYLDMEGIMPKKLRWIMEERDKLKKDIKVLENKLHNEELDDNTRKELEKEKEDKRNYSKYLKADGHSWYGLLGTIGSENAFPLASGDIGTDITRTARAHQQHNIDEISEMTVNLNEVLKEMEIDDLLSKDLDLDFDVIYGDTDGAKYIINQIGELLEFIEEYDIDERNLMVALGKKVAEKLNDGYDDMAEELIGTRDHYFHVKNEPPLKKYAQLGAKKRYVGLDYRDELHVKGFEMKRSNTNQFVRNVQEGIFYEIFDDKTAKQIAKYIKEGFENMRKGLLDEELAYASGWNTDGNWLTKFVKWSNKNTENEFKHGDKIFYYFVKRSHDLPNPPKDGHGRRIFVLDYREIPEDYGYKIDYDAHEQTFLDMKSIRSVFEIFNTDYDDALSGYSQGSVSDYM